ncbi:MAG: QueT transporter family protein [Clostridia bacterium]|nr:QueT transporter family protein [Clostridia bacterium]
MNKTKNTRYIVTGAIIAAAYVVLTFISNIFGLAFGPIQLRISEALCILPLFTPAAIPGLTIGCFISNILSFNVLDMLFGTLATLTAAVLTSVFKNKLLFGMPLLSLLPPVLINALVVGLEITLFIEQPAGFFITAMQVGIGQFIVCFLLGIPLYFAIKNKRNIF